MDLINDVQKIKEVIDNNDFVLGYFTTTDCNLCKDLFPKIQNLADQYPNLIGIKAEADVDKKIVSAFEVFTAPTVILFVEGKETVRYSRKISIQELKSKIDRFYDLFYN